MKATMEEWFNTCWKDQNIPSLSSLIITINSEESLLLKTLIVFPIQWDIMTELEQANSQKPSPPECPPAKVFVPQALRKKLMQQAHSGLRSGHPWITATLHFLQNKFLWSIMRIDTIDFIHGCITCNESKTPRQLLSGLLQPLTSSPPTMVSSGH